MLANNLRTRTAVYGGGAVIHAVIVRSRKIGNVPVDEPGGISLAVRLAISFISIIVLRQRQKVSKEDFGWGVV